jgi:hypothetical protein
VKGRQYRSTGVFARGEVVTVLEVLPGARVRVAYGTVRDLIVAEHNLVEIDATARPGDGTTAHGAAARQTQPKKQLDQDLVLGVLAAAGADGLTDFEIAARTGRKQTSLGVRRGELVEAKCVVWSGRRRPSDTGTPAKVWTITDLGLDRVTELDIRTAPTLSHPEGVA